MYQIPEESLTSLCQLLAEHSGGHKIESEYGYYGWDSPCSTWYSRYNINQVTEKNILAAIKEIRQQHPAEKPVFLYYTEELKSGHLDSLLEADGFHCMSEQIGMICSMSEKEWTDEGENCDKIERINLDKVNEWSLVNARAFQKPAETEALKRLYISRDCDFYAYKDKGQIVATAILHRDEKNAGVHEVSTLSEYRGQGIAKLLIDRITRDAQELGLPLLSLQSSPMGKPVYEKCGFVGVSHIKTWAKFG